MNIYIVDAFTDTPYKGNPAAVCILESEQSDYWMQSVASEMNLSETAFLLRGLQPDFGLWKSVKSRGIIVTCRSARPGIDFVSRCFYPAIGVNEDPVTGSAHCCMGPFWRKRLSKDHFVAQQISRRGGLLKLDVLEGRVLISGQAVTTLRGQLQ